MARPTRFPAAGLPTATNKCAYAFRDYQPHFGYRDVRGRAGIREIARLRRVYGRGRWRKRKGVARIRLSDGTICLAELHWYEAAGIGRREFKIKRLLED